MNDPASLPVDLIIYAVIAAVLVVWLRNTLGTKHGGERSRPNPFTQQPPQAGPSPSRKAAADPGFPVDIQANPAPAAAPLRPADMLDVKNATIAESAKAGIDAVAAADRGFDINNFIMAAQTAFEMVIEAFAKGERDTLKLLVGKSLYADFDKVIIDRELRGETIITDILAIRKIDIIEAGLVGFAARVTLRFHADETSVTRNRDGVVTDGDPNRVVSMVDVWTFERDVKSKDPTWRLIETRGDDNT